MAENKDHLWKSPEDGPEKIEDLVKGGSAPGGHRRRHEQGRRVAAGREGRGLRLPAQRLHPRPLLAGHGEDDPAAERHPLLPGRRRARHLRLRHRALREHVQRRGAPADGRRPPEPEGEAGLAGARGHPPEPACRSRAPRARCWPSPSPPPPRAGGPAHLPRGEPAPVLRLARLQGHGDQRGAGGHLLRARGPQLHRDRRLLRRRHVQRHPRLPLHPLDHGLRSPRRATSSTTRWARRWTSTRRG